MESHVRPLIIYLSQAVFSQRQKERIAEVRDVEIVWGSFKYGEECINSLVTDLGAIGDVTAADSL